MSNRSSYQVIDKAVQEALSGIAAPHQDEVVSSYDEACDRILRIIRAEQRRLGVE